MHTLDEGTASLNIINVAETLNTHKHGREYHREVAELGLKIGLTYEQVNTIVRRLFDKNVPSNIKILSLETREVYSFILNNSDKLRNDIQYAMAMILDQLTAPLTNIIGKDFSFPAECFFTYDASAKTQEIMMKNIYNNYLSSASPRSSSEILFEDYCEERDNIEWIYKNGDKGDQYLSIVYEDSFGKQKSFYPDYIVGSRDGSIWIIETKGGFDRRGNSKDIDKFSARKFEVLKNYIDRYGLKGGIVREDEKSRKLCICMDNYSDDIMSADWKVLKEVL